MNIELQNLKIKGEFVTDLLGIFNAQVYGGSFCTKSVKLHLCYSTQKYDGLITRYFPFSKRELPSKSDVVLS